jgi:lambda family phage tail tape measure protein
VLNKIIDKLQGSFVDSLFSSGGTGGAGGIFGTLFSGLKGLFGFDAGGYTGTGPASAVAGVVHGGEYVFSKKATDRIGVGNLEAMHKGARGYAGGGYVGSPIPRAANNNRQMAVAIGVSVDDDGKIIAYVKSQSEKSEARAAQAGAAAGASAAIRQVPSLSVQSVQNHTERFG